MHIVHLASLLVIGAGWCTAFRVGLHWARRCAVTERAALITLACILPTAGLVFAFHLLALASLISGRGWVTPEATAVLYAGVIVLGQWYVAKLVPPAPDDTSLGQRVRGGLGLGWWWLPIVVVAGMYAVFVCGALARYPIGYDALYYHLPVAVTWMRERAVNLVPGLPPQALPENGIIVPCLLSFAKLETLFSLVHLPDAVICGLSVFALSRMLGLGRPAGVLCACIAASVPMVVFQSVSGYIDLYGAAAWLSALVALGGTTRAPHARQHRGLLLLAGLSAGVALGSKPSHLVLVFLLVMVAAASLWIRRRYGQRDKTCAVHHLLLFVLASLACSGFWFIRGAVQAGNPLYPMEVSIAGKEIWPGETPLDLGFPRRSLSHRLAQWSAYPWRETKYGAGYVYGVDNGLGAAYAAFVPPGLLAALLVAVRRRPRSATESWRLVLLLLALCGFVLVVTAFREVIRYVLPLALVGACVSAATVDRLVRVLPRATLAVATASLVVTAAVATFKPAHCFLGQVRSNVWTRADFYQIPPLVDDLPEGTRILILGDGAAKYPLLGRNLSNVVITPRHWAMLTSGEALCDRTLRQHGIDYLFLRGPQPQDWPADLPVKLVYDGTVEQPPWMSPKARLFKVTANPSQVARANSR